MTALYSICFIVFLFLNGDVQSATWSASSPQDGHQMYACAGDNVTLSWNYTLYEGEDVGDIRWLYVGHSQELVAILSQGNFLPTPSFSQRVTWVDNAGLTLHKVLVQDSGNYSVEVNVYRKSGTLHTLLHHTVTAHVSEHLVTTDGALHVIKNPDPVYNNFTGQWVIQLQCGHFIFKDNPPFHVEWMTPSGRVYNSTYFSQGNFYFHIPMPVETGNYVCSIPEHLAARACLPSSSQSGVAVRVDSVEARLLLLEKENWDLKKKLAVSQAEVTQHQSVIIQQQDFINKQQSINSQQQANNSQYLDFINRQQSINSLLQMNINELNYKASNISLQLQHIKDVERNQVAFHATRLLSETVTASAPLVFNHVIYNLGNAYNSSTGYFTVPYSGLYFFIARTGTTYFDVSEYHHLMVDDQSIDKAFTSIYSGHSNTFQSTAQGVVHLTQGQRVYVKCESNARLWSDVSAFTGFLLSRDP